ncbi:kinase-like domain-containing protein [Aspergillus pseudocaelatus]|uniref:Kinase-like domain-containing protein n=1 Tax=Aspergillus pseudocaelatus TaxID=1825620 RepID=A0ABQ6X206_9EURO|nr:kinase-like domain-containing protein [Aspergillus pseudocaelatus]
MNPSDPCAACSWTPERQQHCSYNSYVKLIYEAGDRGENTSIPVPTVLKSWEEDGHTLILMKCIPGEPLSKAWPRLSTHEKEGIAKQTAEYPLQLGKLQSDNIQSLGGGPVYSNFLFKNKDFDLPHGPLASDDELWAHMERGLNEAITETVRIRLRHRMPPATPYTFTHGDLTNVNVMVENESLIGIVDWETSGYFPVWWEYVYTSVADSEKDREWKTLLRKHMPDYNNAREFWLYYYYLCRSLEHERARKFIEETESSHV